MPDCAVVALDVGVLLRLSGLDVLDVNVLFLSPFQQLATDIFGRLSTARQGYAQHDPERGPE
jgi:hypothetical protein